MHASDEVRMAGNLLIKLETADYNLQQTKQWKEFSELLQHYQNCRVDRQGDFHGDRGQ